MPEKQFVRTQHEWLQKLERTSTVARRFRLSATEPNDVYADAATKTYPNADAFNLAGCDRHCSILSQTLDELGRIGTGDEVLRDLLVNLTRQNTYGTAAELFGYRALIATRRPLTVQPAFDGSKVLNPKGATLDGTIDLGSLVAFDIKAFGLTEHMIKRLTKRLEADLPGTFISISQVNAPSVVELQQLLQQDYKALRDELARDRRADRGELRIEAREPKPVQFTEHVVDPLGLAQRNATHPFNYAKQFTRHMPFMLVFVIHPWWSGLNLSIDFEGIGETFQREFARAAFQDFNADKTLIPKTAGETRSSAVKHLSAILLVDAWEGENARQVRHRLFENANALHPLPTDATDVIKTGLGPSFTFERL